MSIKRREIVYISYHAKDQSWLNRLQVHLAPLLKSEGLSYWSNANIQAGDSLVEMEEAALARACVLVVLLSADYLASPESERMLRAAQAAKLTLLWLPVRPAAYERTAFANIASLLNPVQPLALLSPNQAESELVRAAEYIVEINKAGETANDKPVALAQSAGTTPLLTQGRQGEKKRSQRLRVKAIGGICAALIMGVIGIVCYLEELQRYKYKLIRSQDSILSGKNLIILKPTHWLDLTLAGWHHATTDPDRMCNYFIRACQNAPESKDNRLRPYSDACVPLNFVSKYENKCTSPAAQELVKKDFFKQRCLVRVPPDQTACELLARAYDKGEGKEAPRCALHYHKCACFFELKELFELEPEKCRLDSSLRDPLIPGCHRLRGPVCRRVAEYYVSVQLHLQENPNFRLDDTFFIDDEWDTTISGSKNLDRLISRYKKFADIKTPVPPPSSFFHDCLSKNLIAACPEQLLY